MVSPGKCRISLPQLGDRARLVFIKLLFDQEDRDSVWDSSVKNGACSCVVFNYHCIGDGHDRLLVSEMVKPQRSHRTTILFLCDRSEDKGANGLRYLADAANEV